MKKFLITACKVIVFFVGWAVAAGLIPIPNFLSEAVWRFWAELVPLLCIFVFTAVFLLIDRKNNIKIHFFSNAISSTILGFVFGIVWLGAAVALFLLSGTMKIVGSNTISMLWLWAISVLINAVMQEMLFRGYLYQMIKANYNLFAAAAVTTVLFTAMHSGAFEAGIIPVLNVLSMSVLMTCVLEYTGSLAAPTIMHFLWNFIGAIILGGVSLADDYPNLYNAQFVGNVLLTGGVPKMEGSIIVLFINIALTVLFILLYKRKHSKPELSPQSP